MSKRNGLVKAALLLKELRKLDDDMPIQQAAVFIRVAMMPGITMKQLAEMEGISQSSCSRNVAALSKWHRLNREGLDLVRAMEDPAERRRKIVKLTPKGQRVVETVKRLLGEDEFEETEA